MFAAFSSEPFWFQAVTVAALAAVALLVVLNVLYVFPPLVAEARTWFADDPRAVAARRQQQIAYWNDVLRNVEPVDQTAEQMVRENFARANAVPLRVVPNTRERQIRIEVR